ncbi:acyl carrier protein [Streptodolium elevatio]|uniref:Acyl carrier protein n=1 Tax=Streptodolium elevatio TaxID=3157996 RepID=A0ABV3DPR2_9ACTN
MNQLTLGGFTDILRRAAGEEEDVDLEGDIVEVAFADLGYDSLALLEVAAIVEREFGIAIADEAVQEARTPGMFIGLVNGLLEQPA